MLMMSCLVDVPDYDGDTDHDTDDDTDDDADNGANDDTDDDTDDDNDRTKDRYTAAGAAPDAGAAHTQTRRGHARPGQTKPDPQNTAR